MVPFNTSNHSFHTARSQRRLVRQRQGFQEAHASGNWLLPKIKISLYGQRDPNQNLPRSRERTVCRNWLTPHTFFSVYSIHDKTRSATMHIGYHKGTTSTASDLFPFTSSTSKWYIHFVTSEKMESPPPGWYSIFRTIKSTLDTQECCMAIHLMTVAGLLAAVCVSNRTRWLCFTALKKTATCQSTDDAGLCFAAIESMKGIQR